MTTEEKGEGKEEQKTVEESTQSSELANEEVVELSEEELKNVRESESIGGDEEFLLEIMNMISSSLKEKLEMMQTESQKADDIWKAAHTIKGTALQCGLENLAEAAKNLERAYKNPEGDDLSKREDFMQEFSHESHKVMNTVKKMNKN